MFIRKPVEEIVTEPARKTVRMQHEKFGRTIGINGCFGSSDLGQMTGFIPRALVKEIPNAFMRLPPRSLAGGRRSYAGTAARRLSGRYRRVQGALSAQDTTEGKDIQELARRDKQPIAERARG